MKTKYSNYLLLVLIIVTSFFSIYTFDFHPGESYDKSLDPFRLLTPGVSFSFYIVFLQRRNWPFGRLIVFFFLLMVLYFISFISGLHSWGLAVPFVGGIGAVLIKKLFYQKSRLFDSLGKKYLLFGFCAGLIGFVLYFLAGSFWAYGVAFGLILITWQLVFGVLWTRQIDSVPEKS
jgi:hypothetical protein